MIYENLTVISIWNTLSDYVVSSNTINTFKHRLDKYWCNQDSYRADLHGTRNRRVLSY